STMYAIDGRRLERTSLDDVTACRSKPRRGPKPLTSHRELAAAALELIDEEGLNALTMRRLAERVGLGTMSLYRYFSSKRELLEAALDLAAPRVALRRAEELGWKDQLRSLMVDLQRELARYPGLARERFRLPLRGDQPLATSERMLAIPRGAGFSKSSTVLAYRSLLVLAFGFAAS